ncbi:MAG: winged helix-turn-helix domain-containing protein [Alphaproteobacteria bacterium]|nr:winged helix-turn-helix domain-containing protein [Alphaproteobacteria bacterium]
MARIVADTPGLAALARRAGHHVAADHVDARLLRAVEAVLLEGTDAWDRLRGWRAGGVRAGAVILTRAAPPVDRARLEPVVLLREAAPEALDVALERLFDGRPAGTLELAEGRVDLDRGVFRRSMGRDVGLTTQEVRLLGYLGARSGRPISREELQLQVWDHMKPVPTRAVDMAVSRVRKKIEARHDHPRSLLTVRHGGYRLLLGHARGATSRVAYVGHVELERELRGLLARDRVLVLIGPPGVGKSATARQLVPAGAGPVVDLYGVDRLDAVPGHIAMALRTPLPDALDVDAGLRWVLDALGRTGASLVLDHVDALPGLAARVAALVGPEGVSVVLTARAAPPTGDVQVRRIPPLDAEEAAELLRQRAERAGGTIDPALALELAPLLDGLPLAIELAAGRVRALGAAGLKQWMDARLDVLGGGQGRHATLRTAIEGSWARLGPAARHLLAVLTAFDGPFEPLDASSVAPDPIVQPWIELVDSSLVHPDPGGFRLLHAIRDFAAERLPEVAAEARRAHLAWLVPHVGAWVGALRGVGAREAFDQLVRRRAELEAGLARGAPPEALITLVEGLDALLWTYGTELERLELYARVEEAMAGSPVAAGRLLLRRGLTLQNRERAAALLDLDRAVELLRDEAPETAARAALAAARAARWTEGTRASWARVRGFEGEALSDETRLRMEAWGLLCAEVLREVELRESTRRMLGIVDQLEVRGAIWDASRVALALPNHLRLLGLGDPLALVERVQHWTEQLPDPRLLGQTLISVGVEYGALGQLDAALEAFDRAEAIVRTIEPVRRLQVLQQRACALYQAGELERAQLDLERYTAWCEEEGNALGTADGCLFLAPLACERGMPGRAEAYATRAIDASRRAENDHLLHHARLALGLAQLYDGRPAEAGETLRSVDANLLSSMGRHQLATRLCCAHRILGAPDAALEHAMVALAMEEVGAFGESVRAVVLAGRAADLAALAELGGATGVPMAAEIRLLAKTWRFALGATPSLSAG